MNKPSTKGSASRLLADGSQLERIVELAKKAGLRICNKTAVRWATQGRHGIRLHSIKMRGCRMSTWPAFLAWLDAVEAAECARGGNVSESRASNTVIPFEGVTHHDGGEEQ